MNNYHRKQAVWREKWMRKVEERQRRKAIRDFQRAAIQAGNCIREAFIETANIISDLTNNITDGLKEVINKLQEAPE